MSKEHNMKIVILYFDIWRAEKCLTLTSLLFAWNIDVTCGVAAVILLTHSIKHGIKTGRADREKDCVHCGKEPLCHLWVAHLWTASVGHNTQLFKPLMYSFMLRTAEEILKWYTEWYCNEWRLLCMFRRRKRVRLCSAAHLGTQMQTCPGCTHLFLSTIPTISRLLSSVYIWDLAGVEEGGALLCV